MHRLYWRTPTERASSRGLIWIGICGKGFFRWAASIVRLQTVPGVGLITAAWVVVATLNFTACADGAEARGYAGLVPRPWRAGTSGRGRIWDPAGTRLRTALYRATLAAARWNPGIKAVYERHRAAGKPVQVTRCAAARKLLRLLWAIGTKQQAFDPAYRQAQAARAA